MHGNDTEVVKQSMSSTISVFAGMAVIALTVGLLVKAFEVNLSNNIIMLSFIGIYFVIYIALLFLLHKICNKCFDNIIV